MKKYDSLFSGIIKHFHVMGGPDTARFFLLWKNSVVHLPLLRSSWVRNSIISTDCINSNSFKRKFKLQKKDSTNSCSNSCMRELRFDFSVCVTSIRILRNWVQILPAYFWLKFVSFVLFKRFVCMQNNYSLEESKDYAFFKNFSTDFQKADVLWRS